MKIRFILNPASGKNRRHPGLVPLVQAAVARAGSDAALVFTAGPGHATELARAALRDGCARVVAIGGDGTMNETAQALVGSSAALAIVPMGSGNGLALHLGLPARPGPALDLAIDPSARVTAIDTGTANGHPFFNAMGLGFDAEISRRFNRLTRRGLVAYLRTGFGAFVRHRAESVIVTGGDGSRAVPDAFLVAVSNSDQYGNHALLAPGARVDDGQLDLVAVRSPGLFGAVPLVARLFLGTFDRSARVWHCRGPHFVIQRAAPGFVHTDGETHETTTPVEVVVVPHSLRLVVPAGHRPPPARSMPPTPRPPWTRNVSVSAP
jgi:diacylglycerol kinase (ATP)